LKLTVGLAEDVLGHGDGGVKWLLLLLLMERKQRETTEIVL
jgi:hypothetical protein